MTVNETIKHTYLQSGKHDVNVTLTETDDYCSYTSILIAYVVITPDEIVEACTIFYLNIVPNRTPTNPLQHKIVQSLFLDTELSFSEMMCHDHIAARDIVWKFSTLNGSEIIFNATNNPKNLTISSPIDHFTYEMYNITSEVCLILISLPFFPLL